MPIPFILGAGAALAGITGVALGADAISNNKEADRIRERAEERYENSKEKLEEQRYSTSSSLEALGKVKIKVWADEIDAFLNLYKKFKNVEIKGSANLDERLKMKINNPQTIQSMEIASLKAEEIVKGGIASLGAGALAGIASYGGAMMFASASTGTAIATLSGAAATNATLAWFGGGSLAAGGLGMAGGSAILGGIVAGPALAVAGFLMSEKADENLAAARRYSSEVRVACEKMDTIRDVLETISDLAVNYKSFIYDFAILYRPYLEELDNIHTRAKEEQKNKFANKFKAFLGKDFQVDFNLLSKSEQEVIHITWLLTQILYNVLCAPFLTEKGDIDNNAAPVLDAAITSKDQLLGTN